MKEKFVSLPLQIKKELKMGKRLIIIVLAGLMGLMLPSCGDNPSKETQVNSETGAKTDSTVSTDIDTISVEDQLIESLKESDNPLVGTWVEPAVEGSYLGEVGFALLDNGQMLSINTGFRDYKSWERVGDRIIIRGVINGTEIQTFADTLDIVSVNDKQLVLGQDGYKLTYQKK